MPVDDKGGTFVLDKIEVLSVMQAIRKRPHMYIGSLDDPMTPNRLLQDALCLTLHAGCKGAATKLFIKIKDTGHWTIEDNGPGLSTKVHPQLSERSGRVIREAEVLMTQLAACRAEKPDELKHLCNNGIVVVNALSSEMILTIWNEGAKWRQTYLNGEPEGPMVSEPYPREHTGTWMDFVLDKGLLKNRDIQMEPLLDWLREQRPDGMTIEVRDYVSGAPKVHVIA